MPAFKPYLDQNYDSIKEGLLSSGALFEDDQFPAQISSVFRKRKDSKKIFWKRPSEFCKNEPIFICNKIEPNDLDQGMIGNW